MTYTFQRLTDPVWPRSSRGFRLGVSTLKGVGERNSMNKWYHWTQEPFSPAAKQSPLSRAWQELHRKDKKKFCPHSEKCQRIWWDSGSSDFSLLALLSAPFHSVVDSFHLEFSSTQSYVLRERWIWAREWDSCSWDQPLICYGPNSQWSLQYPFRKKD